MGSVPLSQVSFCGEQFLHYWIERKRRTTTAHTIKNHEDLMKQRVAGELVRFAGKNTAINSRHTGKYTLL